MGKPKQPADGPAKTPLAVTLPVREPVGQSWEWLRPHLNTAWRLSTDLTNWAVHRLYALDAPGEQAMPAAVRDWYGYGDARANFPRWAEWAGSMASAQCVLRAAHRKYKQVRFDVMVRHQGNMLTYRWPQPYPVHNQNWKPSYLPGEFPAATLPIPGAGTVVLRLARGPEFGRQLARFRQLFDGTAERGEAALYRKRDGTLMVKLVGWFPVKPRGSRDNVCFLHTDPNALLVAEVNARKVTVTNGDHLKRAMAVITTTADRHRAFLERSRQDKKREVRMDRRRRAWANAIVEERCGKQRDRIKTAIQQIASQVARFLERQRVGLVAYDDSVKTFLPSFAWHEMKTRLVQLVAMEGGCEWVDGDFVSLNTENGEREAWLAKARATATAGRKAVANAKRPGSHPAVASPSAGSASRRPKKSAASAKR